ncbi:MAG: hypothetical protein DBX41_01800 [Clostridiales bacterium]|nr:MAG: hypothetical protein DBX41_01800 [Clostridiales bacterium]
MKNYFFKILLSEFSAHKKATDEPPPNKQENWKITGEKLAYFSRAAHIMIQTQFMTESIFRHNKYAKICAK